MKFRVLFIIWTCVFCLAAHNCCVSSDSDKLTHELKQTEKSIPLPYHEGLENTVKRYSSLTLSNQFLTYSAFIDTALSQCLLNCGICLWHSAECVATIAKVTVAAFGNCPP